MTTQTVSTSPGDTTFKVLFESAPGLYLVLLPDLTIYAVSDSYADATMTERERIVGKHLFEVFPDNPDDNKADGVSNLRASLNSVIKNKATHTMAVQKYDIRRPDGVFEERYWSPLNKPVLDVEGEVIFIIHRVEDVTEFIQLQKEREERARLADKLLARTLGLEMEIVKRSREIQTLNEKLEKKVIERTSELESIHKVIVDYKFALDSSCIVAVTDQKGVIQHVNDNFCKISKYSRAELIGQDHRIINSGFHTAEFIRNLWVTIANGRIWRGELKNKAKDGTYYWVDTTIVPFLDEKGKPYQYVAIRADITSRKETENHLKKSLKEVSDYKYALDESSIVAITDQRGIIQHANDNFCKISKYSREELIGRDHRIINSGFHTKEFIRSLWVTIANGKIWRGELKNKAKDGTYYWVDTTIVPFLDELGKPYQYVAIRADITTRKDTEVHLQKSLKEISDYKYALDESSIVAITNQKGVIQYANDNFCKISKYPREELIGQDHRIINSGFHSKDFIRKLWVTIANGKIWRGELKNRAKDGSYYWVDTTIIPFLDEQGKPYQYIAIRADITGRKMVEEENIKLNQDLEIRVKQRTEELEAFSYSISHDLRAPLRAVNGYARMLEEDYSGSFDEEGKRLLNVVQDNARKMDTLINNMLAFSKVGKKEINRSIIDMRSLAEDVWAELSKDPKCKAKAEIGELQQAIADRSLINQVWVNLLSNAIKYSANTPEPVVKIHSERKRDMIIYSVADNGVGFDMRYADKLFGVFQRLHSSEDFEGTGVGLAIVHRVITKHGGNVWAEGEVGKGAIFRFSLPVEKLKLV
ncbi:PAS domain-containing sensor histidine kinase [Mucilaginibacter ginsenosidivorans]|nr:PAS domain-containing protein [Mucilaginibacter ginsenosidivorans]